MWGAEAGHPSYSCLKASVRSRVLSSSDNEVEQEDLAQSLSLVKEVIGAVDSKVASYEKKVRLNEIYTRTDSKSIMRMKSGQMFAKEDLKRKKLVRDGSVFLKNTAGRLKGESHGVSESKRAPQESRHNPDVFVRNSPPHFSEGAHPHLHPTLEQLFNLV